jgi:hypothetical protein
LLQAEVRATPLAIRTPHVTARCAQRRRQARAGLRRHHEAEWHHYQSPDLNSHDIPPVVVEHARCSGPMLRIESPPTRPPGPTTRQA